MNILEGIVVGVNNKLALLVEVTRRTPHARYKKLIKTKKTYKVDPNGKTAGFGDRVKISETRPMSKDKRFKIIEILGKAK